MGEKFAYEQWNKMTTQLNKTKELTQEMSKFYFIIHEKVKLIMRKTQTNPLYNPIQDSQNQLNFIKEILQRMANRDQDQYLSSMDPAVLDKYEKSFHDLMDLLALALHTYQSKTKLDISKLMRVSEDSKIKKGQYGLRGELKKSQNRVISSKSGHRLTRNEETQSEAKAQQLLFEFKSESPQVIPFTDLETHTKQYNEKKFKLESMINKHIEKQGMGVSYERKYGQNKLQQYLRERKQFMDLILSQKYYENMIEIGQNRKNEMKMADKKDFDFNKLFPEFNIKTKYMKKQVRQNILQVIFDVKKQLIKQMHDSNMDKMKKVDEVQNQKPITKTKLSIKKSVSMSSVPVSPRKQQTRFQSTNRAMDEKKRSMSTLKYSPQKAAEPIWTKGSNILKLEKKALKMLVSSKMPNYKK